MEHKGVTCKSKPLFNRDNATYRIMFGSKGGIFPPV